MCDKYTQIMTDQAPKVEAAYIPCNMLQYLKTCLSRTVLGVGVRSAAPSVAVDTRQLQRIRFMDMLEPCNFRNVSAYATLDILCAQIMAWHVTAISSLWLF